MSLSSRVLGLALRLLPPSVTSFLPSPVGPLMRELRFFDPATGAQLLTYAESEQSRVRAEQVTAEERQRAEAEQERAERLVEHLCSLGVDPDSLL